MEEKKKKKSQPEIMLLHEYPVIGRYRVRVILRDGVRAFDVREFVKTEKFEGFTRRGVSLTSKEEVESLLDCLVDALKQKVIPPKS